MRTVTVLLAAICLAALPAAARAAAPVSVPVPAEPDALAYAPGHVLWATHSQHGPVVVHQEPSGGGPATVLATVARVHPSSDDLLVSLAATPGGYVITARDGRLITTGECGCDYDVSQGELVVRGGYDGSLSTLVHCVPARNEDEQPELKAAAGSAGYAISGVRCGAPAPVDTIDAAGTVRPVAGITPARFGGLSYAEPFLAAVGTAAGAPRDTAVHVFDTATGARRDLPDRPEWSGGPLQVLPDGTLLLGNGFDTRFPRTIYVWPPAAAAPHPLPGVQAPQLGVGGAGRVLFFPSEDGALRLIGLDGSGLRAVGAPGAGIGRSPLYLDATTAAFLSRSCQGRAQVTTVDLTDSTPPTAPDGCPVHVQGSTVSFDRKGRGTLQVICPNGCRGQMQLYISLHPKQISTHEENRYIDKVFDTRLANAKLGVAASPAAQRVRVKLVRPAIALLRRHHRHLRVFPGFSYSSDLGLGPELPEPVPMLTARLRR